MATQTTGAARVTTPAPNPYRSQTNDKKDPTRAKLETLMETTPFPSQDPKKMPVVRTYISSIANTNHNSEDVIEVHVNGKSTTRVGLKEIQPAVTQKFWKGDYRWRSDYRSSESTYNFTVTAHSNGKDYQKELNPFHEAATLKIFQKNAETFAYFLEGNNDRVLQAGHLEPTSLPAVQDKIDDASSNEKFLSDDDNADFLLRKMVSELHPTHLQ
ncbi:MAG: hypothetical protein KDK76_02025 [Chlamydiia bacterium]|nr:hypothetical protein [Chlamydiia bacterium]